MSQTHHPSGNQRWPGGELGLCHSDACEGTGLWWGLWGQSRPGPPPGREEGGQPLTKAPWAPGQRWRLGLQGGAGAGLQVLWGALRTWPWTGLLEGPRRITSPICKESPPPPLPTPGFLKDGGRVGGWRCLFLSSSLTSSHPAGPNSPPPPRASPRT